MAELNGSNYPNIEVHRLDYKYSTAVSLLARQMESKLESTVMSEGGLKGVTVTAANQLGKFTTRERVGRYEETPFVDLARQRRWYEPKMCSGAVLFDSWDEIRMDIKPDDKVVQTVFAAYGEDKDKEILRAYFAANKTGQKAEKTTPFDTNMIVPADAGGGDVLRKLVLARNLFIKRDVDIDNEEIFCLVSPEMEQELLAAGIYVSQDYMNDKALTGKKLPSYAGINFVRTNLITPSEGKVRLPMYCKSGVALGKWEEITTKFSERNDLSHAKQLYVEYAIGATRLEEAKCAAIEVTAAAA